MKLSALPSPDAFAGVKVLVIGAGGIGCELLKTLVATGFQRIHTIDLDTVDVSNLNRQFLFRKESVGQPKATVAAAAVSHMKPWGSDLRITAERKNITDADFTDETVAQYDLVFNALDNQDARRRMNALCVLAKVPLFEAGSTGYLGQSYTILPKVTPCFDCVPKPVPKTYPVCTIRSTPSQPVHCVVWAKELFQLCFGVATGSMLYADSLPSDAQGGAPIERASAPARAAVALLRYWFQHAAKELQQVAENKGRAVHALDDSAVHHAAREDAAFDPDAALLAPSSMTPEEAAQALVATSMHLWKGAATTAAAPLAFDKDDMWGMMFVAAAATLRCQMFGIRTERAWQLQSIAGNIIPAIATTNAIVAGQQVLQAVRLLDCCPLHKLRAWKAGTGPAPTRADCQALHVAIAPTRVNAVLCREVQAGPNPGCHVCSRPDPVRVPADLAAASFGSLVQQVLLEQLGFVEPELTLPNHMVVEGLLDEDTQQRLFSRALSQLFRGVLRHRALVEVAEGDPDALQHTVLVQLVHTPGALVHAGTRRPRQG